MAEPAPSPVAPIMFKDFTPGIADTPGLQYPHEQATRTNTYRCIAVPSGALVGGPRRNFTIAGTNFETPAAGFFNVSGLLATGGVGPTDLTKLSTDGRQHELFLAVEYANGGNHKFKIERHRLDENTGTRDLVENFSQAVAGNGGSGVGVSWAVTRALRSAPLSPGIPIVLWSWIPYDIAGQGFIHQFPNDATPTLINTFSVYGPDVQAHIVGHQGRVLLRKAVGYSHGPGTSWTNSEHIIFTPVNDTGSLSSPSQYVPEHPNGFPLAASMSANELFLVKESGAIVVQGDLNDPIVINLPMVPGTYDVQTPAMSPLGVVYVSRLSGAWLWGHGDRAQQLAPNLNPDFWATQDYFADTLTLGPRYQLEVSDTWVLVPNNWLYDTHLKSWWRIEDTAVLVGRFWTAQRNFFYTAVNTYTTTNTVVYGWDRLLRSSTFSWQSQPIWSSIDRLLAVRQIELIAQGQGTVTLTCTSASGSTTSEVINLANTGFPERFRREFYIQGYYVQLRIQTDSGNTDINSPEVHMVLLHPDTRARVPSA